MFRAMDSAAAGLLAHQSKMEVVSNNIANVNTVGFKAQTYTFKDTLYQNMAASTAGTATVGGSNASQFGYGSLMASIGMDMSTSSPTYAGGLTAALTGDGFYLTAPAKTYEVETDSFKTNGTDWNYTRVGQFVIDSNGFLVDGNGNFVYGFQPTGEEGDEEDSGYSETLSPLRVPSFDGEVAYDSDGDADFDCALATNVQINQLGEIRATLRNSETGEMRAGVPIGQLAVVTFQNPEGLTKVGDNYFKAVGGDNTGDAIATTAGGEIGDLMPGYIETSNVDLARQFVDMIATHRGFQANSKMITVSDEMLSDLVSMKR